MVYSFDTFKKEKLRYTWLSGKYTDKEMIDKYADLYVLHCVNHGYEIESIPELETVCVVAMRNGIIITCTSCFRKDAHKYAKYYSGIGYKVRTLTYDELERYEEDFKAKNQFVDV